MNGSRRIKTHRVTSLLASLELSEWFETWAVCVRSIVCVSAHSLASVEGDAGGFIVGLILWVEVWCEESTLIVYCSNLLRAVGDVRVFVSELVRCLGCFGRSIGDEVVSNRTGVHEVFLYEAVDGMHVSYRTLHLRRWLRVEVDESVLLLLVLRVREVHVVSKFPRSR